MIWFWIVLALGVIAIFMGAAILLGGWLNKNQKRYPRG